MKNSKTTTPESRRRFLKNAAVAGGAASALALAKAGEAAVADSQEAAPGTEGKGYQKTEHVKLYYQSARI